MSLIQASLLLAALLPAYAQSSGGEVKQAPPPAWVQSLPREAAPAANTEQVSDGVSYVLADSQTRLEAQGKSMYRHFATEALNSQGVEKIANIKIGFDPSYESLILHSIQVIRGTQVINKLNMATVKVLQREQELEYLVYDGSKTASVFLDDVRVGDVVEYAYTLHGNNPVFDNHTFGRFDLQWSVPVQHLFTRLLVPQDRTVSILARNTSLQPKLQERDGYRDYQWERRKVPALITESEAPGWYDPYPAVHWSEYKDWAAVVQWALPLYRAPAHISPAMQVEVDRIAREHTDTLGRIQAVLHWVQSEVRYLGVEVGPGSHAPNPPELVFKRRFGDCKDKTLLTITLLKALGISARPALANTESRRGIADWQPMPAAFNHVLVAVKSQDGSYYWLDPTRAPQPGNLANIYQPDFGYALVVDTGTRNLTKMAETPRRNVRQVKAELDASAGVKKPVAYTVSTTMEGVGAESMRSTLASQSHEELQQRYLNYYARFYPGIRVAAPFVIKEDVAANQMTLIEYYAIPDFWPRNQADKRLEGAIYTPDLLEYLRKPENPNRNAPLALNFPADVWHITTIKLPGEWDLEAEHHSVESKAFSFTRDTTYQNDTLTLTDHYLAKQDQLLAKDVADYTSKLAQAREALDYSLYYYDKAAPAKTKPPMVGGGGPSWTLIMLGVMLLGFWLWLAAKLYRYDPPATPGSAGASGLRLGGWLILPTLAVIFMPFRFFAEFYSSLPSYAASTWAGLTQPDGAAYHRLWEPALLFDLTTNLAICVFSVLLAILYFQRRRSVPRLYVALLGAGLLIQLIDYALLHEIPGASVRAEGSEKAIGSAVFGLLIWGCYFMVSERVKQTFVHGRHPAPAESAAMPILPTLASEQT